MGKAIDETGKIYGYLTVLERAGSKTTAQCGYAIVNVVRRLKLPENFCEMGIRNLAAVLV